MDLLRAVLQPSINEEIRGVFNKYMKVSCAGHSPSPSEDWEPEPSSGHRVGAAGELGAAPWPELTWLLTSCCSFPSFSRRQHSTCVTTLGRRWTQSSSSRRRVGAAWSRWAQAHMKVF